jgi:anti-sigma-K factor RskA
MPERSYSTRKKSDEASMTTKNKQPARHDIEELLPWYATGTLTNRDAERVEQALAGDRKLAQRHKLVRRELLFLTSKDRTRQRSTAWLRTQSDSN